jgi:molybdate transport system substrate-binding protein
MLSRRTLSLKALAAVAGLGLGILAGTLPALAEGRLTVFAAASLKNALDAVNTAWQADPEKRATISYAASSALAKQVEEGAPADIFISADLDWMKYLADKNLVVTASQVNLLGNQIVLVAPKDSAVTAKIEKDFKLAELLGDGKLAMADTKAVPAGKYGKAALESLGVWAAVEGKTAQAENVRAALKLVSSGEAALGIVYETDARADATVKVIDTFPADSHPPIIYPVAITTASKNTDAAAFVTFLQSDQAKAIFEAQGFVVLKH